MKKEIENNWGNASYVQPINMGIPKISDVEKNMNETVNLFYERIEKLDSITTKLHGISSRIDFIDEVMKPDSVVTRLQGKTIVLNRMLEYLDNIIDNLEESMK